MMIGYDDKLGTKAYRVYSYEQRREYVSKDVKFMGSYVPQRAETERINAHRERDQQFHGRHPS